MNNLASSKCHIIRITCNIVTFSDVTGSVNTHYTKPYVCVCARLKAMIQDIV